MAAQAVVIEVFVHLGRIPGPPKVHQPVQPVNERHGPSTGHFVTHALPGSAGQSSSFTLLPEPSSVSATASGRLLPPLHPRWSAPPVRKGCPSVGQFTVRKAARDGVQDAPAHRRIGKAEVVPMQEVIGGHIIEPVGRGHIFIAIAGQDAARTTKSTTIRRTWCRNSVTDMTWPGSLAFLTTGCLL